MYLPSLKRIEHTYKVSLRYTMMIMRTSLDTQQIHVFLISSTIRRSRRILTHPLIYLLPQQLLGGDKPNYDVKCLTEISNSESLVQDKHGKHSLNYSASFTYIHTQSESIRLSHSQATYFYLACMFCKNVCRSHHWSTIYQMESLKKFFVIPLIHWNNFLRNHRTINLKKTKRNVQLIIRT